MRVDISVQATFEEFSALLAAAKDTAEENEKRGVVNHGEGGGDTAGSQN